MTFGAKSRHSSSPQSPKRGAIVMPVDQRDAAVRPYLEDVFNGHDLKSLDKYMSEDLVSHWLGDRSLRGIEAWKDAIGGFFDAFPDAAYTLNDLFFSGDKGVLSRRADSHDALPQSQHQRRLCLALPR